MDTFFALVATAAGAAFGIAALVTKFDRHDLKRSDFSIMTGIAASALLALVATGLSEKAKDEVENARHESLLEKIWENETRVDAAKFRAVLRLEFVTGPLADPPILFAKDSVFTIRAGKSQPERFSATSPYFWSEKPLLSKPDIELVASSQEFNRRVRRTVDDDSWTQTIVFTAFTGSIGAFGDSTSWNEMYVEPEFLGYRNKQLQEWKQTISSDYREAFARNEPFGKFYDRSHFDMSFDGSLSPLPVTASLTVYLGSRELFETTGVPAVVMAWDEDVRGLVLTKFPTVQIPKNFFPKFEPKKKEPKLKERADFSWRHVVGWIFAATLAVAGVVYACSLRQQRSSVPDQSRPS